MTKQDIDQSETSWLIYSDYLEENNQLALAEQIRFELDYKPCYYPPPFGPGPYGRGGSNYYIGVGSSFAYVGGLVVTPGGLTSPSLIGSNLGNDVGSNDW